MTWKHEPFVVLKPETASWALWCVRGDDGKPCITTQRVEGWVVTHEVIETREGGAERLIVSRALVFDGMEGLVDCSEDSALVGFTLSPQLDEQDEARAVSHLEAREGYEAKRAARQRGE